MSGRDDPLWYFGYGSNMCRATFLGRRGMRPLATRAGRLDGYRLCFDLPVGSGERGVANLVADIGAQTWGVLYLLRRAELDRLDRTEGVQHGFYERLAVTVVTVDGDPLAAFTYRSRHGRSGRKPSARYLRLLLEGAREQALPAAYVGWLESFELAIDERDGGSNDHDRSRRRSSRWEKAMEKNVRFYFAYNSPYSFLASQRLERELARTGAAVEYKPLYSPRPGGAPDFTTPRLKYLFEDVTRFAQAYGLALNPGPFADTRKACLGFFEAREWGRERPYHDAVYRARWLEGRDIGDEATLTAIAAAAGLAPDAFAGALASGAHEEALARNSQDAEADEVFGVPFLIWAGQRFWGNDRIEWLVRALNGD